MTKIIIDNVSKDIKKNYFWCIYEMKTLHIVQKLILFWSRNFFFSCTSWVETKSRIHQLTLRTFCGLAMFRTCMSTYFVWENRYYRYIFYKILVAAFSFIENEITDFSSLSLNGVFLSAEVVFDVIVITYFLFFSPDDTHAPTTC